MIAINSVPNETPEEEVDLGIEFSFSTGLPGFEEFHQYHLMTDPTYSPPFELLVADDDPEIGFYLVDPILIARDYDPHIPAAALAELELEANEEPDIRVIMTIGVDGPSTTANLAAPILLNF